MFSTAEQKGEEMADVTGPISSLPGSKHDVPEGMQCDDCGAAATIRIQGETDSFGSEMIDLCEACHNKMKDEPVDDIPHWCDWCKNQVTKTFPKRDYEEGMSGPVYYVCTSCSSAYDERVNAELSNSDDEADYGDDWGDDYDDYEDGWERGL